MNKQRWQDWVTAFVGVWVFLSPLVIPYISPDSAATGIVAWNHTIVGLAIAVVGIAALAAYQIWEEWVDAVLGVWLIASPWVLGFTSMTALTWNAVIMGAVVVVLSGWVLATGSGAMRAA